MTEEQIFLKAIELGTSERAAFLESACGDQRERRSRVEALIAAHQQSDCLLDDANLPSTSADPSGVDQTQVIDRYKLREQIGEGGMGTVYIAEQEKPVRRKVALKIIKAGMDTKDVIARFEAERQALALMDHPNIARVLDAGSTNTGRPYFVMELVRGIAITEYCDQQKLSIRERLHLFVQVCHAIQHAHQKGIIHRDIKPTNVLVTEHDGTPVPKVIDFGVAKAIGQKLTDHSIYTHHLQPVGTLQYMSPEQSRLSGLDIDTRSDVYALGLLLYELMTGALPFDKEAFSHATFDEKRRIISEDDAPRPSTRISTLGDSSATVSKQRRMDVDRLQKAMRGELDWILVKALEKDRNRRYDSPAGFAQDISNYLTGSLVEARPPTTAYQLKKLFERHRSVFTVGMTIVAVSLMGTVFSTVQLRRAEKALRELDQKTKQLQLALVDRAVTDAMNGNFPQAKLTIAQASDAEVSEALVEALRSMARYFSGEPVEAAKDLRLATNRFPNSIEVWGVYFLASHSAGDYGPMGECRRRVNQMTPENDIQSLFHAMANVYADPEGVDKKLLPLLERNPNSVMLNTIQAVAHRDLAQRQQDLGILEDVIEKFRIANLRSPGNFFIQTEYLLGLVDGIKFSAFLGQDSSAAGYRRTAEDLVALLEQNDSTKAYSRMSRATYYAAVEDELAVAKIEATTPTGLTTTRHIDAAKLFVEKDFDGMQQRFKDTESYSTAPDSAFGVIEDSMDNETRRSKASGMYRNTVIERPSYAIGSDVVALEVFLFAGDIATLKREAHHLKAKSPDYEWHMYPRILDLYADPTEEAIDSVLAFSRPFSEETSYAEYCVGLIRMAQGNQTEARQHFEDCVKQGKYDWRSHVWSRAFLRRYDLDSAWPQWLQPHKNRSQ